MATLLYLQASPRDRSRSSHIAEAFLARYRQTHPDDTVRTVNLFEADLPAFDGFAVQAKYALMHGASHTDDEARAWGEVEAVIDAFKGADKYLFSVPMWNFGIPYRLKQYIDVIVQPGYTFTVDENGYRGLVTGKPALVVYARGGSYAPGSGMEAFDLQKPYLETLLGFIGFEQVQSVVAEPTLQGEPAAMEAMMLAAVQKAEVLAATF